MSSTLIIEKPELQSNIHRYGWGSVTFIFWMIYIYLWLPLITLVAWWFGAKLFNLHMIQLEGYVGLLNNLGLYSVIIFVISLILIGWAELDRMRFKDKLRRLGNNTVSVAEIAQKYNMQEHELTQLRQKKSMLVHFSDDGFISNINEYAVSSH
jgi:biofilm PGA synthesis protein PgaD